MKLKNFIELNKDNNLEILTINIEHIILFRDNKIYLTGDIELIVLETSEQIQQKILECQNDNILTISDCTYDSIPKDVINVTEKEFRDYLNK